jgi:hypothetical protein
MFATAVADLRAAVRQVWRDISHVTAPSE